MSQCHAGICRSSAVAAAIAKYYDITDVNYFAHRLYYPNDWVYKLMVEAFGMKYEKMERANFYNPGDPLF